MTEVMLKDTRTKFEIRLPPFIVAKFITLIK